MTVRILTENEFPKIKKLKEKFNVIRAIDIKNGAKLEAVELINKDGIFRGFGKSPEKAFKKAQKVLKKYYIA